MAAINPYLNFNGNAEEAFNFYKSVFGGDFATLMRFGDVPSEHQMSETDRAKIMHVALPVGQGNLLMGCDMPEVFGQAKIGNNFSISITAESQQEADRLFNALSAGGKVTMPMDKAFWGSYFGMLVDRYEIQWMVSFDFGQQ